MRLYDVFSQDKDALEESQTADMRAFFAGADRDNPVQNPGRAATPAEIKALMTKMIQFGERSLTQSELSKVKEYQRGRRLFVSRRIDVGEATGSQLNVQQLATISDAALDDAYHYGRSTPGNTFGWQANLKSAEFAAKLINAGETDIEKISDAIHQGWNVTAQAFVSNPEQFDDTEKLRAAGKLEGKLAQREKLMNIGYAQLPNNEQEKDRVVARALLQAITGGGEQGVAEGGFPKKISQKEVDQFQKKHNDKLTGREVNRQEQEKKPADNNKKQGVAKEGYGTHPSQRVDPVTGKRYVPPKSPLGEGVAEGVPQPGPSSGAPKQFGPNAKIQTRQMTVKDIISSVPGVPYYNNVVDDWDAKDYSWGVTKKVIEYATYLKDHPESLSKLPPAIVLNGKFEDGAHRVSAIWLLQQRMDPKNPLWKNAKLNVQFVKQGVAEGWSQKYKSSINCSHPKGFSQKAHCAGKKKHNESVEMEMVCEDCGMCKTHGSVNEIAKSAKDSNGFTKCWSGHHAAGTKKGKNGGQVRNCVPNEGVAETEPTHRIGVTVTDPNHAMVSKRGETVQKSIRVTHADRDAAINRAIAHYRKKGYKVHDHHYMGTIEPGVAEAKTSAAVRLGRAIDRTQGKTAASQARSVIPSSIPKKEEPKRDEKKVDEGIQAGDGFIIECGDSAIETVVLGDYLDGILIEFDHTATFMLIDAGITLTEAEYHGRTVPLGKRMAGDVKKSKVYVKKPNGKVVKVNFGDPNMRIKKSSPARRKSFRARHNCENPGPRWKARYWSCRAW